jgi:hypothetical protein
LQLTPNYALANSIPNVQTYIAQLELQLSSTNQITTEAHSDISNESENIDAEVKIYRFGQYLAELALNHQY